MARTSSAKKTASPEAPLVSDLKFESAVEELAQIVEKMEQGQLALEESIAAYHRGSELLKHCQQLLTHAEQEIQILDNDSLRSFNLPSKASE